VKSHLVIGLGNRLMGDEGIGGHVIDRLASDPRLPEDTELIWCGTDLLACADQVEGRSRVTLIDALLDPGEVGRVLVLRDQEGLGGLEDGEGHVHHLSLTRAIHLLGIASPSFQTARLRLIAISIDSARMETELSPALAARLPEILDSVLRELTSTC
jgi:hydrogenase maturation protease